MDNAMQLAKARHAATKATAAQSLLEVESKTEAKFIDPFMGGMGGFGMQPPMGMGGMGMGGMGFPCMGMGMGMGPMGGMGYGNMGPGYMGMNPGYGNTMLGGLGMGMGL